VTLISETQERERYKIILQSHSPGMDYSLTLVLKEMVPMEVKGQPRAAQAGSPLLSSPSADLYCVLFCFFAASS
jgi:hypothetical protein